MPSEPFRDVGGRSPRPPAPQLPASSPSPISFHAMRLFIAVPLPPPALEQAGFLLRGLMEREWPVRWVRDDGLHITLKFFGEVMPDRLDAIEDALRHAAAGIHSVSLALGTGGALPTPRRPRVLHLEVHAGPELEVLQDRLERACSEIGFAPEGRPFIPHITLGRG